MPIRTYGCPDCGNVMDVVLTVAEWETPPPDCPVCTAQTEQHFKPFAVGGSVQGRAAAIAQDIAEKDFGLTNFELGRHGEPAAPRYGAPAVPKAPPGVDPQAVLKGMIGSTGRAQIDPSRSGAGFSPLRALQDGIKGGLIPDLVGKRNVAANSIKIG
jgi:putative FmdB family regulatory protein